MENTLIMNHLMNLTEKTSDELWKLNDRLKNNQRKDYSNVIQFIEKIETVD